MLETGGHIFNLVHLKTMIGKVKLSAVLSRIFSRVNMPGCDINLCAYYPKKLAKFSVRHMKEKYQVLVFYVRR